MNVEAAIDGDVIGRVIVIWNDFFGNIIME
jgi:hypothetical protein